MTGAFVVDASVAIAWVHPAQPTSQTVAMLDAIADGATIEVPAQLSVYDAAYLELAQRRRLLLGCKDAALRAAATSAGVGPSA